MSSLNIASLHPDSSKKAYVSLKRVKRLWWEKEHGPQETTFCDNITSKLRSSPPHPRSAELAANTNGALWAQSSFLLQRKETDGIGNGRSARGRVWGRGTQGRAALVLCPPGQSLSCQEALVPTRKSQRALLSSSCWYSTKWTRSIPHMLNCSLQTLKVWSPKKHAVTVWPSP